MFIQHVWCRILCAVIVIAFSTEAISKTDFKDLTTCNSSCSMNELEDKVYCFNSLDISISCPITTSSSNCIPSVNTAFGDLNPFGDIEQFNNLSGSASISIAEEGEVLILSDDEFLNTTSGCTIKRYYYIYYDSNNNGIFLEVNPIVTCSVTYTIEDNTAPTWLENPGSLNGSTTCDAFEIPRPTPVDNCDNITLTVEIDQTDGPCINKPTLYTWIATDQCGNQSTPFNVNIQITDQTMPTFDCTLLSDLILNCDSPTIPEDIEEWLTQSEEIIEANATDFCTINLDIENDYVTGTLPTISCNGTEGLDIIWSITDACGNTIQCTVTLIIRSTGGIIATCDTNDLFINCESTTASQEINTWLDAQTTELMATTFGSCGSTNNVTNDYILGALPTDCSNPIEVTFLLIDECGNNFACTANISLVDTTNPEFDQFSIPTYFPITCDGQPELQEVIPAFDNCSEVVIITMPSMPPVVDICNGYDIVYTWLATDECGNTSTVESVTQVLPDNVPPVFDFAPTAIAPIACDDPYPNFETLTATDNCGLVDITTSFTVTNNSFCVANILTYTWTAIDECGNESEVSLDITINPDNNQPTIDCQDLIVDVDPGDCEATINLTPPNFSDACSSVVITNSFGTNTIIRPAGIYSVTWTATDECGNEDSCIQEITVKDLQSPEIVCNGDLSVSLNNIGTGFINFDQIIMEASDNCPGPLSYFIYVMDDRCGDPDNEVPSTELEICCANVGTLMVVAEVHDQEGNIAQCMVDVTVNDVNPPYLVDQLTDVTISCEYPIDLDDLTEFGTYVSITGSGTSFIITDPELGELTIMDGEVSDNCGATVQEEEPIIDLECGVGRIIRVFSATDAQGNQTLVYQTITIENYSPFTEDDITWPEENITITNQCMADVPPTSMTGLPSYTSGNCQSILFNHKDYVSKVNDGCMFVKRKFTVIDWCQYDPNVQPTAGRWEFTQDITVENTIDPVFQNCESEIVMCGNESTCTGLVNTTIEATDDCITDIHYSWNIDINNDNDQSNDISGEGNTISEDVAYGIHELQWWASDGCGNVAACTQTLNVQDCKPPVPVCLYGIALNINEMPGIGIMGTIWAEDYDGGSTDNCTEKEDLQFAFDEAFTLTSMTFDCDDLGQQDISLYVMDSDGNISHCETYINVQDNYNLCPETIIENDENEIELRLSGNVITLNNEVMSDIGINLIADVHGQETTTDNGGAYAFDGIPMYADFMLDPSYDDKAINGLTTLDLILIQKHILGLELLDNPYKIIAADVNNSESVTAIDIIEIRKIILGIQEEFTKVDTWRFFDGHIEFGDPLNPFPISENMQMYGLDHDASGMDFIAVKSGDINQSADLSGLQQNIVTRNANPISWKILKRERGLIQLTVNDDLFLNGFQFSIDPSANAAILNLRSDVLDLEYGNYVFKDGSAKVSWSNAESIRLKKGTVLLEVQLNREGNISLSKDPNLSNEVYLSDGTVNNLVFESTDNLDSDWRIFANTPNPFTNETYIPFIAPEALTATLSVFDQSGKVIFQKTKDLKKGYQQWKIDGSDLGNVHGVLYYRLESGDFSSTQPFIKLE